jgi:hypothetical protein
MHAYTDRMTIWFLWWIASLETLSSLDHSQLLQATRTKKLNMRLVKTKLPVADMPWWYDEREMMQLELSRNRKREVFYTTKHGSYACKNNFAIPP